MRRADRFFTVLALACALVAGAGAWGIWGDEAGQFAADVQLQREIAGDPRYRFIEALEVEYPGVYAVDVEIETDATDRNWLRVYLMFDRRVTGEFGNEPDENGHTPIYKYVGEFTAWIAEYADMHGYDRLKVGLVYVERVDVLGDEAWQATMIMYALGNVDEFMQWIEKSGTNMDALMERAQYTNRMTVYTWSPFYPAEHHTTYLERPFEEPLWVTLERLEAEAGDWHAARGADSCQ